jgi:hypothetical protein
VIAFETSVRVERGIGDVFSYVSDPLAFPRWNSAVRAVHRTSATTYRLERELPTGRAVNELEVVTREPRREFAIRTTAGPTPFIYRYRLVPAGGATLVSLDAEVELPTPAFLSQLARRVVKKGVDDNLATLRRILERASPQRT